MPVLDETISAPGDFTVEFPPDRPDPARYCHRYLSSPRKYIFPRARVTIVEETMTSNLVDKPFSNMKRITNV